MPSSGTNVPRYELSIPRGSGATLRLAVTKGGVPYDLSLPGTALVVTGAHRGTRLFQHVYVSSGTTAPAGTTAADGSITVNPSDDPGINVAHVRLGRADTSGLAASDVVSWDAWLYTSEPDPVPVAVGTIRVQALPYDPA